MKYLHTMLRVRNLDDALHFYVELLGLKEARRRVDEKNKYTLVFLYAPEDEAVVKASMDKTGRDQPMLELTYNWDTEDYGGALFRPPRLRGRRHLRDLRQTDEGRRHHQPPTARRQHGVRALTRQAIGRAAAEGQAAAAAGAVGLDEEHRELVRFARRPALAPRRQALYTSPRFQRRLAFAPFV